MLGWNISVFRQTDGGAAPARVESDAGTQLAVWQADACGLDWLDDLVRQGHALDLGGNGYPCRYTGQAKNVLPPVLGGPPRAREIWHTDPWDIVSEEWVGKTVVDSMAADSCPPEEWLLIVAWDES